MKKRLEFIDAIKGFSILLVVYCHYTLLPGDSFMGNMIMSMAWCAVPCFLMCSGAMINLSKSFDMKNYLIRLARLYGALCSWRLIYLVCTIAINHSRPSLIKIINYIFFLCDLEGVDASVMWYIIAYIGVMLLYPMLYYLFKNSPKALAFVLIVLSVQAILIPCLSRAVSAVFIHLRCEDMPNVAMLNRMFPFSSSSNVLFYYILGIFIFKYKREILNKVPIIMLFLLAGVSIAGLMAVKYLSTGSWRWGDIYLTDGYSRLGTLTLSVAVWLIFAWLEMINDSKVNGVLGVLAHFLGDKTMGIYYLHYIMLVALKLTIFYMLPKAIGMNIVKTIIVAFIAAIITKIIKLIPVAREIVK